MGDAMLNLLQKYAWPALAPSKSMIVAETVPHCHGRCDLKSLANIRVAHSRTITIYDYSWYSSWIVIDDATWNRLNVYAWPTPGTSKHPWLQHRRCLHWHRWCYLKSSAKVCMAHSSIIWDGPYIAMDDAMGNRLKTYAWPTPAPSKSMIVDDAVRTLRTYAQAPPGPFSMCFSLIDSIR